MNRTLTYEISTEYDSFPIDKYLKSQGYSSANITAIKKMPNNVVINGQWVHMNRKLSAGEVLTVNISEDNSSEKIPPVKMALDIVYEDEDIIVINKPAGLPIHPSLNHYEDSLANGLTYYYESQGKPFIFRCANRLDKNTSGLTVIAKHLVSANILSTMVKNRQFHREYYAIV
ncbi:MAG: RluA family pseudouridine synthase, partial [Eubacterium sp.]|nr:RluA family pseudouridine synthase [Eubacterium sp.]